MNPVTYTSDYSREYAVGLNQCKTLCRLREYLEHWMAFAHKAYLISQRMTAISFKEFRRGLESERQGVYAGDEWAEKYGEIIMPEILTHAGVVAVKFNVPWGLAFIRLRDTGMIREDNGVYVWTPADLSS